MAAERKVHCLEDLCDFINGFAFKSTDYVAQSPDTLEVFRMGYIQKGGGFKEDNSPVFVPRKYSRDLKKYLLKPGDVTIAMTDMKDRVAILGNTAWIRDADRFVLNQRVGCIRVKKPDLLEPRFLYFYSNLQPYVEYLRSRANSGVQVNLSTSAIKESELEIPPLPEQRAIAGVLGALDDKIELNRRTNRTLEKLARAIFRAWFVDFEPVKAKAAGARSFPSMPQEAFDALPTRLVPSELGPIPEGWEMGTMGDIGRQRREKVSPEDTAEGTAYIGLEHMPRRCIALYEWGVANAVKSAKSRFSTGNILFGKLRPYFHKVGPAPLDGICSTDIVVVSSKKPEAAAWLLMLVSTDEFVSHANQTSAGTKMPRTNWKDMANFPMALPSVPLFQAFQEVAAPMLDLIRQGIYESRKLAAMRDYLLPKLLSGEVRVGEVERMLKGSTG